MVNRAIRRFNPILPGLFVFELIWIIVYHHNRIACLFIRIQIPDSKNFDSLVLYNILKIFEIKFTKICQYSSKSKKID